MTFVKVQDDNEKNMISIIAAMDEKRGIGKDGKIPWHIPEDFKRFKKITWGHPIIMGRKTFESVLSYIHKAPPGRTNIIVTRDENYKYEDCIIAHSFEEALDIAKKEELKKYSSSEQSESRSSRQARTISPEIFIGGGGQIFKEAMEKGIVDRLYLTIVEARLDSPPDSPARRGDFGADTFFPDYSGFKIVKEEPGQSGEYKFKFVNLEK